MTGPSRRHRASRGQALPILAVLIVVLTGVAGLAIDGGHDYLVRRQMQLAADTAALAGAKQLAITGAQLFSPPKTGDTSILAAHDFAQQNGFATIYGTACDQATNAGFTTTWFDAAVACSATTGFHTSVTVNSPPKLIAGQGALPTSCASTFIFNCIQVVINRVVPHFFLSALGQPTATTTVVSTGYAQPSASAYTGPALTAVYLYEPSGGACNSSAQQCFATGKSPARTQLSCSTNVSSNNNCPTFWAVNGTQPLIAGFDGTKTKPQQDFTALEAVGDMVIQDNTTICDPYNGATCKNGTTTGSKGFAINTGKLYCANFGGGASANGLTNCTTGGQGGLKNINANETTYASYSWTPDISTSLPTCGALVLNGLTVAQSFTVQPGGSGSSSCTNTAEPYTVQPGIYQYIVVNHGTYDFESGVFDITGSAPVNTNTASGYWANGIDHSKETSGSDWDLCNSNQPNACPTLTAGVWFGHGGGSYGAAAAQLQGTCQNGGQVGGTAGGGGDQTVIIGPGVTFRLESTAGGFVSTGEVQGILLTAPGINASPAVHGVPILIDMENNNFVHLDGQGQGTTTSGLTGLVYQTAGATAGGVEINPQLTNNKGPALVGQVWAYSFTVFGGSSAATIDFSNGYGTGSTPQIATSGHSESSIITSTSYSTTNVVSPTGAALSGYGLLSIRYADEWALDGYDTYVKVNGSNPYFFSSGIWSPAPASGSPLPPEPNGTGPDDTPSHAAWPTTASPGSFSYKLDPITGQYTDWYETIPYGTGGQTAIFETSGNWTWGHQSDISSAHGGNYVATVNFYFPIPSGSSATITIFMTDGDHCGDYALTTLTVVIPGQVQQVVGTVGLVQ